MNIIINHPIEPRKIKNQNKSPTDSFFDIKEYNI